MNAKPRKPRKRSMVVAYAAKEPLSSFTALGPQHWRTARSILDEIEGSVSPGFSFHWKGASTLCLFHAAFECFLNEELAIITARGLPDLTKMRLLQDAYVSEKIEPFLQHFGIEHAFSQTIAAEVKRMCKVRNLAYHHSPEMRPHNECPDVVLETIKSVGLTPMRVSWASYLGHVSVLRWARDSVANFIDEFDRCLKRPSTLASSGSGWMVTYESPASDPAGV